ncbi:FecR family protein [Chitinophaga costaii]|nr:FecR family protein [Chitinophaga costaii]
MKQYNGVDLLERYTNGTASPEEVAIVESWHLHFSLDNREVLPAAAMVEDLAAIRQQLITISNKPVVRPLWYKVAAAAVLLAGIAMGTYLLAHRHPVMTVRELAAHDIQPGKNAATLTLSNGTRIVLDEQLQGKVAEQAGVRVTKNATGEIVYDDAAVSGGGEHLYNTLTTSKGETYQLNLPDGSKVWLNAASSLRYAASFNGLSERKVQLTGEAYFEVATDAQHPFIVVANRQEVKVLGTRFNINSYADEPVTKTTLAEGAVSINEQAILKPGQVATSSQAGLLQVQTGDVAMALAWRTGQFYFKDLPLPAVMRQISRWYNLDIEYQQTPTDDTFNGVIDRNASLSRILKILERGGVRFQVQDRKLIVIP